MAAVAIVVFLCTGVGRGALHRNITADADGRWDNEVTRTLCAALLVAITNLANTKSTAWHRVKSHQGSIVVGGIWWHAGCVCMAPLML